MTNSHIVKFRAVDRPLNEKQLEFMKRQSSRAEFSRWSFEVEYNYSSFRGDINAMLQNGYDIFLQVSNYDGRDVRIRMPNGFPFPKKVWSKYLNADGVEWIPDKKGNGGVLAISPTIEDADWLDSDGEEYLDSLAKLREMLVAGDIRGLYFVWLCGAISENDDPEELKEPPVPHGMDEFPIEVAELLFLFEQDPLLVTAAGSGIPKFDARKSEAEQVSEWVASLTDERKVSIIERLLKEDPVVVKADLMSEIRSSQKAMVWPLKAPTRTLADLMEQCEILQTIEDEKNKRARAAEAKRTAEKAEKERQKRIAEIKANPRRWLEKATELVNLRGRESYYKAAEIVAEVREAVGTEEGREMACTYAAQLVKDNPTLSVLKSAMRKKGLVALPPRG